MPGRPRSSQQKDPARHLLCTPASPPRWPSWDPSGGGLPCSTSPHDGGGRGGIGHRLIALRAPGFCRCLHGAAAGMGVSTTETGDVVRGSGVDSSDDTRAPRRAGVEQLAAPCRAGLERRVAEPRTCFGRQLAPSGQVRLVKHRAASPVSGGLGGPPSRVICRRTAHRKPSEAIGRVEKMVKEEMGERRRGAILARCLSGLM